MSKKELSYPLNGRDFEVMTQQGSFYFEGDKNLFESQKVLNNYNEEVDIITTLQNWHSHEVINQYDIELKNDRKLWETPLEKLLDNEWFYNYIKQNKSGFYSGVNRKG